MKISPFLFMSLIILLLSNTLARADNTVNVQAGCAPWDGPTIALTVRTPENEYGVVIWAAGHQALSNGERTIHINNKSFTPDSRDSTGTAYRQPLSASGTPPSPITPNLTVQFDQFDFKEGSTISGYLDDAGSHIPFSGTLLGQSICG